MFDTLGGPPRGGADVGEVYFDQPRVLVSAGTTPTQVRMRARRRALGAYRVTAEAPFQVRCGATGDFAAECTASDLAANAEASLAVRIMPGATVPTTSARLRVWWGRRVESVSLVAPSGTRGVAAATGLYRGTATLVSTTVLRGTTGTARPVSAFVAPLRARVFDSVLELQDDLAVLSVDEAMAGGLSLTGSDQTVLFPQRTWMSGLAVADLTAMQSVSYERSNLTFDPGTGSLSFTLRGTVKGVFEGGADLLLEWRVALLRNGALPTGATAPTVPMDAAMPARVANTPSAWESSVRRAASEAASPRTRDDWEAIVRSTTRQSLVDRTNNPVSASRRLDGCNESLTIPASAWTELTNARWAPAAYTAPSGGAPLADVATSQVGSQSLVALVARAATAFGNARIVSFTPGVSQSLSTDGGVACAYNFPTQNADTCSAGSETYGAVDRCEEIARELGCVPEAAPTPNPPATIRGTLRMLPATGSQCTSAVEVTGTITRVCRLTRPSPARCAELLACTSSVTPTGTVSSLPIATSPGSSSISGDLSCTPPTMGGSSVSLATGADARRDASPVPVPTTELLADCVTELARLRATPPSTGALTAVTGLSSLTSARCLDAVKHFVALSLATEADRQVGLSTMGATRDAASTRFAVRLLQQWLQVHSLLASESAQRMSVPTRLRPAVTGATLPEPRDGLDLALGGLALVQHPRFATALLAMAGDTLRAPDYRADWVPMLSTQAWHTQPRGLSAAMYDGTSAALSLLADLLEDATLAGSRELLTYRGRLAGRTLRSAVVTAALASELDATARTGGTPDRRYIDATNTALSEHNTQLGRALAAASALLDDQNPLGITADDLPLYFFGGARDPGQRFTAISTYLLGNAASGNSDWATQLMAQLTTAEGQLMAAFREQADRGYRTRLDTAQQAARVGQVASDFGERLGNLCGYPSGVTAGNAITDWAMRTGRPFDASNCYVRREETSCRRASAPNITRDDVLFHVCMGKELRGSGVPVRFADNRLEQILQNFNPTECSPLAACPAGVGALTSQCITCGPRVAEVSWDLVSAGSVLSAEGVDTAASAVERCMQLFPTARRLPPTPENDPTLTGACYRGSLGESMMSVRAAATDVALARAQLNDQLESFELAVRSCEIGREGSEEVARLRQSMNAALTTLRAIKLAADIVGYWSDATAACGYGVSQIDGLSAGATIGGTAIGVIVGCAASGVSAAAQTTSASLQLAMDEVQQWTESDILTVEDRTTFRVCLNDANQYLVGMRTAALQVQRAQQDLFAAEFRMREGIAEAQRTYDEGVAELAAVNESEVRPPAIDPWVDVRTRQYRDAFRRARRFVFLAARAVEYEFQLSSPLPSRALRAQSAEELQNVLNELRTTTQTGRINGNAPSALRVVLSLRQHLLALQDRSMLPASEQALSDVQRFRLLLNNPNFAVRDTSGAITGYQIPFSLVPVGTLRSRDAMGIPVLAGNDCAERLWSVNASIIGTAGEVLVGDGSTFTRLDLLKRNTFFSQWCTAPAAGTPRFQQASVRPSVNLFRDPEAGALGTIGGTSVGLGNETQLFARARMQPRVNVSRADFEDDRYANGETSELAGRGLYGDYALYIPASVLSGTNTDGTRTPGLNLGAVDDLLLRIDYVSVARAGR